MKQWQPSSLLSAGLIVETDKDRFVPAEGVKLRVEERGHPDFNVEVVGFIRTSDYGDNPWGFFHIDSNGRKHEFPLGEYDMITVDTPE